MDYNLIYYNLYLFIITNKPGCCPVRGVLVCFCGTILHIVIDPVLADVPVLDQVSIRTN